MITILSVDDSEEIQALIRKSFPSSNYLVTSVGTLSKAKEVLETSHFDIVLLDIELPDGDGLKSYAEFKANNLLANTPVFILTGKTSIQEKSLGFQLGIEDYITKPFDLVELRLRVDSRLRKISEKQNQDNVVHVGNLKIHLDHHRISIFIDSKEQKVDVSSTEFKILAYLAKNKEQVKSREQIMNTVWGDTVEFCDRTIDSHISRLRKKMNPCDYKIESVANVGYRFSPK